MTLIQAVQSSNKEFTKFCNSLRCPLCQGQLDGNIHPTKARLYCVNDNNEYSCEYYSDNNIPITELIVYVYTQYEYEVSINKYDNKFQTSILRYNLDAAPIHRSSTRKEIFSYYGNRILFFHKRMEEDAFLNKLKTYMVFS